MKNKSKKYSFENIPSETLQRKLIRLAEEKYEIRGEEKPLIKAYAWARKKGFWSLRVWRHFVWHTMQQIDKERQRRNLPSKYV